MDVSLRSVSKSYRGGVTALDRMDLEIPTGMFGLLGANGAGKTTLMRILAGVLHPTTGSVRIGERELTNRDDRQQVKRRLGYLPQELGLYPDLSARRFLDYVGILKGLDNRRARRHRVDEVLGLVGLDEVADRRVGAYSGGMKRRVGIAQAILNDPVLLVVDEPTAGLDPEERVRFRMLLASLGGKRTVLLSTHIVEDVASTCHLCAVMAKGRVLYRGEVQELAQAAAGKVWSVETAEPLSDIEAATVVSAIQLDTRTVYRVVADEMPRPEATPIEPGLEDGYLALVRSDRSNTSAEEVVRNRRSNR